MQLKKELLMRKAARLYSVGMELDYAREKLANMVEKKVPFDSIQMIDAYDEYKKLEDEWNSLEIEYLDLRDELNYKKVLA